jgi:hypothetical protein
MVKFKAQEILKPEFTVVNEDFKILKQRKSFHFLVITRNTFYKILYELNGLQIFLNSLSMHLFRN